MSKFKVGDEVTPTVNGGWEPFGEEPSDGPMPKFGEIYIVLGYDGDGYVILSKLSPKDSFDDRFFEKVISTPMLYKEIERKTQEV
jgi:hypothetical protein